MIRTCESEGKGTYLWQACSFWIQILDTVPQFIAASNLTCTVWCSISNLTCTVWQIISNAAGNLSLFWISWRVPVANLKATLCILAASSLAQIYMTLVCQKWGNLLYTWVRASWIEFNNCPTRCNLFSLSHFCRQLYMFRVLTPIIRSSYNCTYSFWYWLTRSTTIHSRWVGTDSYVSYGKYSFVMEGLWRKTGVDG